MTAACDRCRTDDSLLTNPFHVLQPKGISKPPSSYYPTPRPNAISTESTDQPHSAYGADEVVYSALTAVRPSFTSAEASNLLRLRLLNIPNGCSPILLPTRTTRLDLPRLGMPNLPLRMPVLKVPPMARLERIRKLTMWIWK